MRETGKLNRNRGCMWCFYAGVPIGSHQNRNRIASLLISENRIAKKSHCYFWRKSHRNRNRRILAIFSAIFLRFFIIILINYVLVFSDFLFQNQWFFSENFFNLPALTCSNVDRCLPWRQVSILLLNIPTINFKQVHCLLKVNRYVEWDRRDAERR